MPKLTVIQGGALQLPSWLCFPATTEVRGYSDPSTLSVVRVSAERALRSAVEAQRQPAFELWSMILGTAPPVNNVNCPGNQPYQQGLTRLTDAHACFHGLKRPIAADDHGDEMLTFVLQPSYYYRYDSSSEEGMFAVARRRAVPADLVFLAHVRLDQPPDESRPMIGALTHWGFAERSPDEQTLPIDFDTRFNGRHW